MEMKRYKETKEKLRRRKEEAKRMRARSMLDKSLDSPFSSSFASTSASAAEVDDTDLMVSHKIVEDKCIVDELDVLTKKKKISPYEEWQKVKQRLGKKRAAKLAEAGGGGSDGSGASSSFRSSPSGGAGSSSSSKIGKRKKLDLNSEEAKKIKEKFRGEIAGVIVQNLGAYRKDTCQNGRITNTEDFKHLARKVSVFCSFVQVPILIVRHHFLPAHAFRSSEGAEALRQHNQRTDRVGLGADQSPRVHQKVYGQARQRVRARRKRTRLRQHKSLRGGQGEGDSGSATGGGEGGAGSSIRCVRTGFEPQDGHCE